ncbi:unnamed protein product [Haemonchus placei]|uniref:BTB_2 domain-containing protein n=1 Tax=Haemonchus placei TaxID=6290 RepID=A0A0N4X0X5_HAEPC|nr:unnamed protein product [Haemonchus placei]
MQGCAVYDAIIWWSIAGGMADIADFSNHQGTKGEVFIDRDPTLFKYILNYLRDGRVMFADDPLTAALLFQEAKVHLKVLFYQKK